MSGNGIKKLMLHYSIHRSYSFTRSHISVAQHPIFVKMWNLTWHFFPYNFVKLNTMQLLLKFIVWLHGSAKW